MSVLFLAVEGGSFFVAALNLVIPGVQVALTFSLFKPVRAAAIPALGKRLSRAMKSGNTVAAKALWEEAGSTRSLMNCRESCGIDNAITHAMQTMSQNL